MLRGLPQCLQTLLTDIKFHPKTHVEMVNTDRYLNEIYNGRLIVTYKSIADIILAHQRPRQSRHFHIMNNFSTMQFHLCMLLPYNTIYTENFNTIIFQIYSSGLYYKWMDDTLYDMIHIGILPKLLNLSNAQFQNSLTMNDLRSLCVMLLFGYVIATLVCVIEILIPKLKMFLPFLQSYLS